MSECVNPVCAANNLKLERLLTKLKAFRNSLRNPLGKGYAPDIYADELTRLIGDKKSIDRMD